MKKFIIFIPAFVVVFLACNDRNTTKENQVSPATPSDTVQTVSENKDSVLLQLTNTILTLIKAQEYSAFSNFIDTVNGIRFSPYGYVDTVHHVVFSKNEFSEIVQKHSHRKILWGQFDGTGDAINMTLHEYMKRFVYDVDFLSAEKRKVNEFIGQGNSLNNLQTIYKGCDFTESHFPGFDKKYEGMDWRSLRLVFRKSGDRYYLTAVVHDQWTS